MTNDPLLQPYRLKHLTLKNRVMSTAHEPAYSEDGLPKARYRLYHAEKARGGMALTLFIVAFALKVLRFLPVSLADSAVDPHAK